MKKYLILIIIAVVVLIYIFLPSGDDNREIEVILDGVIQAGKEKNLDGVMEHFSINYRDDYGATYPVVKNIAKTFFDKFDGFDGKYSDLTVSIDDTEEGEKQAVANFDISVSGIRSSIPTPILGSGDVPQNLIVTLRKSKLTGWKIIKVEGVELEENF